MTGKLTRAFVLSGVALAALAAATPVYAQTTSAQQSAVRDFNVPAQPLSQAALTFSQQAGVQLVLESGVAQGVTSNAIDGRMSVSNALTQLLRGTPLTWRFVNDGTVAIEAARTASDGERVTGSVRVEGAQGSPYFGGAGVAAGVNGTNGSRDITATEGTGSFTSGALTIGSKVPQALKDVPQSVSVLTQERMEQQNVTNFNDALAKMPGVSVYMGGSGGGVTNQEGEYLSRGFPILSIQVEGGAPLQTSSIGYFPQIDMAQYDHIELLRGAAGLFNGYGNPSGTINLVRKKPLDHGQVSLEAQAGSWSNYRLVLDATSPLALDGALRGRLVMTWQDNHYFYDIAKDNKSLIYGIVEYDLSPTTLLNIGGSHTLQRSVPVQNGLPRYQNGDDLKLPRSTALAFPWNRFDLDTTEIFGGFEQKIGGEWAIKANVTYNKQDNVQKLGYSYYSINPLNDLGPRLQGNFRRYGTKQLSAEATIAGAFQIFGQRQEIVAGINRSDSNGDGFVTYSSLIAGTSANPYQPYPGGPIYCASASICPLGASPRIDVFDFDPSDPLYTEPRDPLVANRSPVFGSISTVAYLNLKLTAFDRLHLTTGIRWSRYENNSTTQAYCTALATYGSCAGKQIGDLKATYVQNYRGDDFSWPPAVNLSYDLTKQLNAYVGYTDIYRSQANWFNGDLKPIDPITGSNWEAGLKWAPRDGKLNFSVAVYRIHERGFGVEDNQDRYVRNPDGSIFYDPDIDYYPYILDNAGNRIISGQVSPGTFCCYLNRYDQTNTSQGIDVEIAGEITPGFQISASYNYTENKREGNYYGSSQGKPFITIQPKHLYKLWASYDFRAAGQTGWLSNLALSGGVTGRSAGQFSGYVCRNFLPPNPATGASDCVSYTDEDYQPFKFTAQPYAIFSARIDYRFSDHWSLAVNLENLLDKSYYAVVGNSPDSGNWYGTPRSFTATLRAKW